MPHKHKKTRRTPASAAWRAVVCGYEGLVDSRPGAVGLLASPAAGLLASAVDVHGVAEHRAAEIALITVVIHDVELAGVVGVRIAPAVPGVNAAGGEAVAVGVVGLAAVAAVFAGQALAIARDGGGSHSMPTPAPVPRSAQAPVPARAAVVPHLARSLTARAIGAISSYEASCRFLNLPAVCEI